MRCFIDSDVVLDLLSARPPFFGAAVSFFHAIELGEARAAVAALTFSNAYYVMRPDMGSKAVLARLEKFRFLAEVLAVDGRQIQKALGSNFDDFEDAIQYECAMTHKMDCIVARNKKDYRLSAIPVYTPVDALKVIRRKR